MLGKSVPKTEIKANWGALSWALAKGRINCIVANGNATAKIYTFILFPPNKRSSADKTR